MYYSSASIVISENHYGLEAGQKRQAKDNSGDIMFSKQVKDGPVKGDIRGRMAGIHQTCLNQIYSLELTALLHLVSLERFYSNHLIMFIYEY